MDSRGAKAEPVSSAARWTCTSGAGEMRVSDWVVGVIADGAHNSAYSVIIRCFRRMTLQHAWSGRRSGLGMWAGALTLLTVSCSLLRGQGPQPGWISPQEPAQPATRR